MMDRVITLTIITGPSVDSPPSRTLGRGCCEAPSPSSPREIKLEAGVCPLGEVTGTCSPPRN